MSNFTSQVGHKRGRCFKKVVAQVCRAFNCTGVGAFQTVRYSSFQKRETFSENSDRNVVVSFWNPASSNRVLLLLASC